MRRVVIVLLVLTSLVGLSLPAVADIDPTEIGKAVTAVEQLDQMRTGLADTLLEVKSEPTIGTFKEVCAPVGKQAQAIAKENGWQVRQVALKYRNPKHQPQNLSEEKALAEFVEHPDLTAFWERDEQGVHYYRRINVQASCLACHGAKDSRPSFVKDKYPQDLAYDFQVGDLRGMYAVIIPELQQALSTHE
jgi:hypothetical protein